MPVTPNSKLPYPAATDPADVPADLQKLALALDEIGYDQITADVTVTGASDPASTMVIPGSAHTFDGAPVIAEFFCSMVETFAAVNGLVIVSLFEGATQITRLALVNNVATGGGLALPVCARYRFTPSAGAHTYSVKAMQVNGNGTIHAGTGGAAGQPPAYLRFTKV